MWRQVAASAIMVPMQVLYTAIYTAIAILFAPAVAWVLWTQKGYRQDFGQRLGLYHESVRRRLAVPAGTRCWLHAASIGEVHVALHFLQALRRQLPHVQVVLTTTTIEGRTLAEQRRPSDVEILYFPFDYPAAIRRAFRLIAPDFIALVELEVWPNHLWTAASHHVPVFLINGRMPPGDARRYRRARWLFRRLFAGLALVCAQDSDDATRFAEFGVMPARLHVTGNLKYDIALEQLNQVPGLRIDAAGLLRRIGVTESRSVLVAGSTHVGEEAILFDLLASMTPESPRPFLVVAPRDLARIPQIASLAQRMNLTSLRRSEIGSHSATAERAVDCLLLDTMGELSEFYAEATVAFVGKSLTGHGGQNIIEAAAGGHPVVFGPHMEHFKAITQQFLTDGAAVQVADARALRSAVQRLLNDGTERDRISTAARLVIDANAGATSRTVALIIAELQSEAPRRLPTGSAV